ncbi:hypothetical protein [Nocardioides mesophilus]|uniref:Uncharacterized protein n=1 Tax=Nocardioides mesophilus TaxID=433659 RepID=A0A7G9R6D0_9ACTN|nr:hypothetical protein [Nocardioides mesophilus]QNN51155.1 hypothetical protein H9L09_10845 [Nocardioides mesophilus]
MEVFPPPHEELLGWHVGVGTTRRVAEFATKWASLSGGECWAACSDEAMKIEGCCAADFLCSAASVAEYGATLIYPVDSHKLTHCTMAPRGEFIAQSIERPGHWQAQVAELVEVLLAAPEAADVGMIKRAREEASSWLEIGQQTNKPARLVIDYQASRHLWDRYVIDAHGVNLLTDYHLDNAHDLSDWTVEEVSPGRHLVSAKNLASWYSGGPTPYDVIQRARADFGKMILDWDTIQSHPGPYTNLNPNIIGR